MLSAVSRSRNKVDEHSQWWKCDLSPRYEMYYLAIFTFCHCFHKHLCVKYLQSTNLTHFQWKKECWFMIICFVYLLKIVIKTSQGNYSLKQNFKKDFIYLFLERGEGRERRERGRKDRKGRKKKAAKLWASREWQGMLGVKTPFPHHSKGPGLWSDGTIYTEPWVCRQKREYHSLQAAASAPGLPKSSLGHHP